MPIEGATTRFCTATQPGTYSVKFRRRTDEVLDESFPVQIAENTSGQAPVLTSTGSLHLPIQSFGSFSNAVNLIAPTGYSQYRWHQNNSLLGTSTSNVRFITSGSGNNPSLDGAYTVQVLQPGGCWSPHSNPITITHNDPQPISPAFTILSRTARSPTEIEVTWQDVDGETGYEIWRYRRGDYIDGASPSGYPFRPFTLLTTLPVNTTSFVDTGLRPGASYIYRVRAIVPGGAVFSNAPNPTFVLTLNDSNPPTKPGNISVVDVSFTEATLQWTPSADNDVVYEYEIFNGPFKIAGIRNDTTDTDRTDGNPQPPLTYTVKGLLPGLTYLLNVRANDYRGHNPESNHSLLAGISITTLLDLGLTSSLSADQNTMLYPVPFKDELHIRFKEKKGLQSVTLYRLNDGSAVHSAIVNSDDEEATLNFSGVGKGHYVLTVGSSRHVVMKE